MFNTLFYTFNTLYTFNTGCWRILNVPVNVPGFQRKAKNLTVDGGLKPADPKVKLFGKVQENQEPA